MKYRKRNEWRLPYLIFSKRFYGCKQPEPVLCCYVVRLRKPGFGLWVSYVGGERATIITLKDRKKDLIRSWKRWGSHVMIDLTLKNKLIK